MHSRHGGVTNTCGGARASSRVMSAQAPTFEWPNTHGYFGRVLELVLVSRRWCAVHVLYRVTLEFELGDSVLCEGNTGPLLFVCAQTQRLFQ